jgi:ATP-dependent helicase HrpB
MTQKLPIDEQLPEILSVFSTVQALVVQAPPGAGKTTRIPLALLQSSFIENQRIIMLEPRRLAAVNAARWMAAALGEEVGNTVGYTIRFERKVSPSTRIEVVTEGILGRRLQSDPMLTGVGVVIFDEFHERSLQSDLALALCRDMQLGLREELKIMVMSATLDGEPIARILGDAPIITSRGRVFPVTIRYLPQMKGGRLVDTVSRAIVSIVADTKGDILVFLPGGGEIRACQRLLEQQLHAPGAPLVCPLYGNLPFAAQEKAIMPAARRKIVLATNIAETSLTIEGISVVVDSGYTRVLRFEAATGINRLITERVTAASSEQRAGRAGRLGPGTVYRLWSEHEQRTLLPFTAPEIKSADLCSLALDLAQWGVKDADSLIWLDPPPSASLGEGRRLLQKLGALDRDLKITETGRSMAELPVHPRLSRMLLAGKTIKCGALACDVAALLTEREILRAPHAWSSDSDLLDRLEALSGWRRGVSNAAIDTNACNAVDRAAEQMRRLLRVSGERAPATVELLASLLVTAYPDRIARQREAGSDKYLLASGQGAVLSHRTAVANRLFIIALNVEGGKPGEVMIHQASTLTEATIRSCCSGAIITARSVTWDSGEGRVIAREEERLGAILLASRPIVPAGDELVAALLQGVKSGPGLRACNWSPAAIQLRARVVFLSQHAPEKGWPDFSDMHLLDTLDQWLGPYLGGITSLAALARVDLYQPLKGCLTWEQQQLLDSGAPTHFTVPSGSRVVLDYAGDDPPVLAVKLQELFGLGETPTVVWGRIPVLVHLLSPARRPLQVTRDLKGFWNGAYHEVKKELRGRYPRHPWPDDPWNAVPTGKTSKRKV